MFQNFMGFQQSIVDNGHRFAMLGASSSHNKLSYLQESMGGLSAISKFAPFVANQDDLMKKEIEKVEAMHRKLESMKSELLFVSNEKLTNDQIKVINEINIDLGSSKKMMRLLQGDVGCGKTIVAFITAASVIKNDYQVAIMVPTEILAMQHYKLFKNLFKDENINIE